MVDTSTKGSTPRKGASKANAGTAPTGDTSPSLQDQGPRDQVKDESGRQASKSLVQKPTVGGIAKDAMFLHFLMPIHVIAPGSGTFEIERLYYQDGEYTALAGFKGRVGPEVILGADLNDERLLITTTNFQLTVPTSQVTGNYSR